MGRLSLTAVDFSHMYRLSRRHEFYKVQSELTDLNTELEAKRRNWQMFVKRSMN